MTHQTPNQRVDAMKRSKDRRYYSLRLRSDFADLIEAGLRANGGMKQKDLGKACGLSESYISRLINAATNFKIGVVARILLPLGITPMIVDKAEWDRLNVAAKLGDSPAVRKIPVPQNAEVLYGDTIKNDRPIRVFVGKLSDSSGTAIYRIRGRSGPTDRLVRQHAGNKEVGCTSTGRFALSSTPRISERAV